jgi:hypothetical protein
MTHHQDEMVWRVRPRFLYQADGTLYFLHLGALYAVPMHSGLIDLQTDNREVDVATGVDAELTARCRTIQSVLLGAYEKKEGDGTPHE